VFPRSASGAASPCARRCGASAGARRRARPHADDVDGALVRSLAPLPIVHVLAAFPHIPSRRVMPHASRRRGDPFSPLAASAGSPSPPESFCEPRPGRCEQVAEPPSSVHLALQPEDLPEASGRHLHRHGPRQRRDLRRSRECGLRNVTGLDGEIVAASTKKRCGFTCTRTRGPGGAPCGPGFATAPACPCSVLHAAAPGLKLRSAVRSRCHGTSGQACSTARPVPLQRDTACSSGR